MSDSVKAQLWGFGSLGATLLIIMYANNFCVGSVQSSAGVFILCVGFIKALQYALR